MNKIDELAKIIWDYHHMHHKLKKADAIFVLGSHDTRIGEYAAEMYHQDYAPLVIFSGGIAHNKDLLNTGWGKPEAEILSEAAENKGVPKDHILLETKATNTQENIEMVRELLKKKNIQVNNFILVQKPYMERRTYATFKNFWPEIDFVVSSPPISFEEYCSGEIKKEDIINLMVGDLQRIKEYPKKGFQIEQKIPPKVWSAYEKLAELGYTKHLIKE